jgi:hypothetical protein
MKAGCCAGCNNGNWGGCGLVVVVVVKNMEEKVVDMQVS